MCKGYKLTPIGLVEVCRGVKMSPLQAFFLGVKIGFFKVLVLSALAVAIFPDGVFAFVRSVGYLF